VSRKQTALIDDVLGRVKPVICSLSWFDKLPADVQQETLELQRRYRDGEVAINPMQLGRAIVDAYSARGYAMPLPRQVRDWLVHKKA
jgi:hypothetical protein